MGSDKVDKKDKKKDRKEKKEKHSETEGVKKSKKEKKEKKDKKEKKKKFKEVDGDLQIVAAPVHDDSESGEELDAMDLDLVIRVAGAPPPEALVPFAKPLADSEQTKEMLRAVKKASKNKTLKRGVKEVQKALRKTSTNQPSSSYNTNPVGVVIMAADISPMDVISHLPVLCEDCNIPYIYVSSRAELGIAGNTKRATSVVLLMKERSKSKRKKAEESAGDVAGPEDPEWATTYAAVVKMVLAAGKTVLR